MESDEDDYDIEYFGEDQIGSASGEDESTPGKTVAATAASMVSEVGAAAGGIIRGLFKTARDDLQLVGSVIKMALS